MNRQKEFTEEGRYMPISKVAGGGSSKTYKAVWAIGVTSATKITLKTDDIDGIGTVYTNDDTLSDGDTIAITYDEVEPEDVFDAGLTTVVRGESVLWVNGFDGGQGVYPLYLQVAADGPDAAE